MNAYFQLISLLLLLLISCGGSTSDVTDSTLSNSGNFNNSATTTTPNNPTPSYIFNNELVWSDEFDQDGLVSQDKWNVETIPPNLSLIHI